MVGETGSGKTTQYGAGTWVVDGMLTGVQNSAVRVLLGSATHKREDGCMHSAASSRGYVRGETCRRRDGRYVPYLSVESGFSRALQFSSASKSATPFDLRI
jgi:hypothetical protein